MQGVVEDESSNRNTESQHHAKYLMFSFKSLQASRREDRLYLLCRWETDLNQISQASVYLSRHNKTAYRLGDLTEIYFLTVVEAQSSRSRSSRVGFILSLFFFLLTDGGHLAECSHVPIWCMSMGWGQEPESSGVAVTQTLSRRIRATALGLHLTFLPLRLHVLVQPPWR